MGTDGISDASAKVEVKLSKVEVSHKLGVHCSIHCPVVAIEEVVEVVADEGSVQRLEH